jgi:hypothetical protein
MTRFGAFSCFGAKMRDQLSQKSYFDEYVDFNDESIERKLGRLDRIAEEKKAGSIYDAIRYAHDALLMRYSRGDSVDDLRCCVQ